MTVIDTSRKNVNRRQVPMPSLADLFAKASVRAGLTQKDLAAIWGVDPAQVSRWMASGRVPFRELDLLPDEFWVGLISLLADRHHMAVKAVDIEVQLLNTAIDALTQLAQHKLKG